MHDEFANILDQALKRLLKPLEQKLNQQATLVASLQETTQGLVSTQFERRLNQLEEDLEALRMCYKALEMQLPELRQLCATLLEISAKLSTDSTTLQRIEALESEAHSHHSVLREIEKRLQQLMESYLGLRGLSEDFGTVREEQKKIAVALPSLQSSLSGLKKSLKAFKPK